MVSRVPDTQKGVQNVKALEVRLHAVATVPVIDYYRQNNIP